MPRLMKKFSYLHLEPFLSNIDVYIDKSLMTSGSHEHYIPHSTIGSTSPGFAIKIQLTNQILLPILQQ